MSTQVRASIGTPFDSDEHSDSAEIAEERRQTCDRKGRVAGDWKRMKHPQ